MTTKAEATALITQLQGLLHNLPAKDQSFATGLMQSTIDKGPTTNRVYWLNELIARAEKYSTTPPQTTPGAVPGEPEKVTVGTFAKVMALFDLAKQNLQKPRIRLQLQNGAPLVLAVAGQKAKQPGTVDVTDGGSYGYSTWYGRVTKEGVWEKSAKHAEHHEEIGALLIKLGEAPAQVAAEYGRLTGRCCFCALKLTDERSTAAGFGPVCAKNFGLLDAWKESEALLLTREAQTIGVGE